MGVENLSGKNNVEDLSEDMIGGAPESRVHGAVSPDIIWRMSADNFFKIKERDEEDLERAMDQARKRRKRWYDWGPEGCLKNSGRKPTKHTP